MDMAALFIQMAAFLSCNAAISRQWSWSQVFWSRRESRLDGQEGHFVHEKIFKSLQDSKTPSSESNGREVLVTWLMRIPYGSWGGCEVFSWKTNFHTVFSARQGEFMIYLTANEREPNKQIP